MMAMALGPTFLAFNRPDLTQRIECSSLTLKERNFQLILGSLSFSILMWGSFMFISILLYREEMLTQVGMFRILNSFIFLLVSIGIAFLISQVVKGGEALFAASNVIGLGLSFLSGVFVPLDVLNENVLRFSRFTPTYWYIRNNNLLTTQFSLTNQSIQSFREAAMIQLTFALAIFAVTLVIIKQKKLKPKI